MSIDKAELRRLAKEAGAQIEQWSTVPKLDGLFHMTPEQLEKFAALLLDAKEREIERLGIKVTALLDQLVDLGGELREPELYEAEQLRKNSDRYKWLRNGTSGTRDARNRQSFDMPDPHPLGNIMQGSVAQHLDAAIDAAIASEQEKGKS